MSVHAQVADTTGAAADTTSANETAAPDTTGATETAEPDTSVTDATAAPDTILTETVIAGPDSAIAAPDTAAADTARVVDLIDVDTRAKDTDDPEIMRITVETIEWKRQDAMMRADTSALRKIYSEDLTYTHSMGLMQSREQVLTMITEGNVSYDRFVTRNMIWRVYNNVVVGAGSQTIDLTIDENPATARNRYTVVYVKIDGNWRCVAYQSTPLPIIREQQMIR
jgi:ketosteroid isomerase-like protein